MLRVVITSPLRIGCVALPTTTPYMMIWSPGAKSFKANLCLAGTSVTTLWFSLARLTSSPARRSVKAIITLSRRSSFRIRFWIRVSGTFFHDGSIRSFRKCDFLHAFRHTVERENDIPRTRSVNLDKSAAGLRRRAGGNTYIFDPFHANHNLFGIRLCRAKARYLQVPPIAKCKRWAGSRIHSQLLEPRLLRIRAG